MIININDDPSSNTTLLRNEMRRSGWCQSSVLAVVVFACWLPEHKHWRDTIQETPPVSTAGPSLASVRLPLGIDQTPGREDRMEDRLCRGAVVEWKGRENKDGGRNGGGFGSGGVETRLELV